MTFIPRPTEPLIDGRGHVSRVWLDFFRGLSGDQATTELRAALGALTLRVDGLSDNPTQQNNLIGQGSVRVYGDLSQSNASAQLDGDENSPEASRYYGTDGSGQRGFHALVLAALADVDLSTDPVTGNALVFNGAAWAPGQVSGGDVDGGTANSVYTAAQVIDGGSA